MAKWLTLFMKMNLGFIKMTNYVLRKMFRDGEPRAHFRWVSKVQILRNRFGLIRSKLNPWVGPYLASWFSKPWALLWAQIFLGSKPIDFPFKMVPCKFSLDLPLVGLGSSSKGRGSNLWLSANRICSISLDPRPWTLM
jgi:hypothetical protein